MAVPQNTSLFMSVPTLDGTDVCGCVIYIPHLVRVSSYLSTYRGNFRLSGTCLQCLHGRIALMLSSTLATHYTTIFLHSHLRAGNHSSTQHLVNSAKTSIPRQLNESYTTDKYGRKLDHWKNTAYVSTRNDCSVFNDKRQCISTTHECLWAKDQTLTNSQRPLALKI